jgi:Sulfotransferase family
MKTRNPNFFIVGAPKSGTTSLDHYLRQHPDVFMPSRKDLPFFGSDLHMRFTYEYGRVRETLEQYLSYFEQAGSARRIGETTVWYLFSERAAEEIHRFAPDALIIVMLRNPVDMMYALHSQFLSNLNENIDNFEAALAAEVDRRDGHRIPTRAHFPQGLLYRDVARYSEQLERYFTIFGRDRVHIVYYDDFRDHTHREVCKTFEFLGLDPSVPVNLDIINPNKVVRHRLLHALAMAPPTRLESLYHALTPSRFHGRAAALARRMSLEHKPRPPLDPDFRDRLEREMASEILQLGSLLDRDMSSWLASQGVT